MSCEVRVDVERHSGGVRCILIKSTACLITFDITMIANKYEGKRKIIGKVQEYDVRHI